MTGRTWMADAACRHPDANPEAFFPTSGRASRGAPPDATVWCRACPVTAECLTAAMADPHTEGVWGGVMFTGMRRTRAQREAS